MVAEDRYSRRQKDKEDRDDQQYEDKLQYFVNILKTKLSSQEDILIESIIINSEKETGKFNYDGRKKAFNELQREELTQYTKELDILGVSPEKIIEDYVFYLKKRILLDFPEYKIQNIMDEYYLFILKKDEIKENLVKNGEVLPENISDIDLFIGLIDCHKSRKKGIKNLLSLIRSIDLKVEKEILEEIAQQKLKEALNQKSPKEKLINSIGKEILNEFKSLIELEKASGQIFPQFDIIGYCISKINNKYNFRFSEEEENILTEIGQNHLKKLN